MITKFYMYRGPDHELKARVVSRTGLQFALEEIPPETFDRWMENNKPQLRNKLMAPKNTKITKKFYVGAPHLIADNSNYCHQDMRDAVNEAIIKCEESGEAQIVVQIVRVIRPKSIPIVVERV